MPLNCIIFLGEFFSLPYFQNYCETFPCFFVRGIKCLCTGNCQLLSLLLSTPLKGEICLFKVIISKHTYETILLNCDFDDVGAVVIFCQNKMMMMMVVIMVTDIKELHDIANMVVIGIVPIRKVDVVPIILLVPLG